MRYEDERYVRVYTRDTMTWLAWPWEARALFPLLLRKVDRAGLLDLGDHGDAGLAVMVALPPEVVHIGLEALVLSGTVQRNGTTLLVPRFLDAQECAQSDAQRKREQRAKARDKAAASQNGMVESRAVTDGHENGQKVTRGHTRSHAVTRGHSVPSVPSRTEPGGEAPPSAPTVRVLPERPVVTLAPITDRAREIALGVQQSGGPFDVDGEWLSFQTSGKSQNDGEWQHWCSLAVKWAKNARQRANGTSNGTASELVRGHHGRWETNPAVFGEFGGYGDSASIVGQLGAGPTKGPKGEQRVRLAKRARLALEGGD